MSNSNYRSRIDCTGFAVVAGIIIGIITAFLRFSAVITVTPAFLWVVFGIAIVYLALAFLQRGNVCNGAAIGCCASYTTFIIGVLGSILTALVLLAITFAATSVIGAIITGLLLFFFSLLILSTVCLLRCTSACFRSDD